jgi:hypothetical protein
VGFPGHVLFLLGGVSVPLFHRAASRDEAVLTWPTFLPFKSSAENRAYQRAWYRKQGDAYKAEKQRTQDDRLRQNLAFTRKYKQDHGCADCGEKDPIVLEFDHRDPEKKVDDVSAGWYRGWSKSKLLAEMKKCDVVCANCHRRRTAAARWRDVDLQPSTQLELY